MQFNSSTKSTKINIGNLKKSKSISLNSNNTDSVYEEIDYSNPEDIDINSVVREMVSNNTALEQTKQLKGILEERKEQLESKIDYLEYLQNLDELYGTESSVPKVGVFYPQTFEDFVQSSQTSESSQDLETSLKELKQDYEIICALIPKLDYEIKMSSYESLKSTLQYQDYINNYTCEKDNIDYDLLALYNYDITSYINEITRGKSNEEIQTMIDNGELKINPLSLVEYLENNLPEGKTIDDIIANMTYLKDMSTNYKYMTEDEKMMYHYLFDTEGEESANEYMSLIQDKINQVHGVDLANDFLNTLDVDSEGNLEENVANILGVSIEGLGDGIDNFFNGIENAIINNEKLTAEDYKKMIILQTLQEQSDSLTWRYQFSTSLGNMVPAMTTSAIVSFLGTPAAGATVGSVLMGTSAYGNAKHQALTEGNSTLSSTIYGLLIGTSEATLGYFLGKIPGISQTTGFTLKSLLCEGVEEYSQTWIDAGLQAIVLGNDVDWSSIPEEAKDSFIMGMLMSGFLNGGQSIINVTINGLSCEINVDAILEYLEKNPSASMQEALEKSSPMASSAINSNTNTTVTYQEMYNKINEYSAKYGGCNAAITQIMYESYQTKNYKYTRSVAKECINYLCNVLGYNSKDAAHQVGQLYSSALSRFNMQPFYDQETGITINIIENMDTNLQIVSPNQVIAELHSLPKDFVSCVKNIYFYDTFNPDDFYWELEYNIKDFHSGATGGAGQMTYWVNSGYKASTLAHEIAHNYDSEYAAVWGAKTGYISTSKAWLKAMEADKKINGLTGVSEYARSSGSSMEDFADAVSFFYNNPQELDKFPNRKALLEKYLPKRQYSDQTISETYSTVYKNMASIYGEANAEGYLKNYINSGNLGFIPDQNNLREIVSSHSLDEWKNYYNSLEMQRINDHYKAVEYTFNVVYNDLKVKYGEQNAKTIMQNYLNTGNTSYITRTDGLRDKISTYSVEDYQDYIKAINNNSSDISNY